MVRGCSKIHRKQEISLRLDPERKGFSVICSVSLDPCPELQHPREQEQVSRTETEPKGNTARSLLGRGMGVGNLSQACPDMESE